VDRRQKFESVNEGENILRRRQIQWIALVFMWVGAIEVAVSFLIHYWFTVNIPGTPVFFLLLVMGLAVYLVTRIL
jgi:hypothetical protein